MRHSARLLLKKVDGEVGRLASRLNDLATMIPLSVPDVNDNPVNYYRWLDGNKLLASADK